MRTLGIIQPGRIGDIIICLPIAKWYFDQGYIVYWPILNSYVSNFKERIDYVNFIPLETMDCNEARVSCVSKCNTIIDLSITFPNSHPVNDYLFQNAAKMLAFDQLKYQIANVPFDRKWTLEFKRNRDSEDRLESLFTDLSVPFTLVHAEGSSEAFVYQPDAGESVIHVKNITNSIFDWCRFIDRAKKIVAIDSCFANLVEQYGYEGPKFLVRRSADVRPTYKNWTVI